LDPAFWKLVRDGVTSHLEIETYTFDVLPKDLQPTCVEESIASEYRWTLKNLC
jgi:isochorismate hydrolase